MQMRCPTDGWRKLPDATGVTVEKAALSRSVCLFRPFLGTKFAEDVQIDSSEDHRVWCACPALPPVRAREIGPKPKAGSGDFSILLVDCIPKVD